MLEMIDPKTSTVLVTGATSGFGAAVSRRFAGAGAKVIATGRRADRLAALKKELGELCHMVSFDAREREATEEAFALLPSEFSRPNVVVANEAVEKSLF
jgi:NADP-dependent 3-hydroxy acid dehydrogenase YdfG